MAALQVFIFFIVAFGLIYIRVPVLIWTLTLGVVLFVLSWLDPSHWFFLSVLWVLFLSATSFALLKKVRQRYFTTPLNKILQKRMPPISSTEREAIEAGHVWWEKDLFCGRPDWKKFFAMPVPKLTHEERNFIENQVETLCNMVNAWQIENVDNDLSPAIWNYLKQERFFGMVIPKEYGGHGFSALAHSTIIVKIATRNISTAVNTMVPNSLGPGELLLHYGTEAQKKYYLPRLATGEDIPCFALTGPEAGSDAGSITDSGIVCYGEFQGESVLGIRLTWDKRYITLAPIATVLGIAFRLYDPENLLGKGEDVGITLCLVPTSHPGVEIGNRHWPLQLAFMNGPTRGKNVFIPIDWIIGGVNRAGQGWKMLMECLSIGRAISLPALSTASCKLVYRATGAYSRLRRQFNTSIANFEGVEEVLGNIAGLTYMTEACRLLTAGAVDQKIKPAIASAIAKYHMTEMLRKTVGHAMDVHAGHAIQIGPRNVLSHIYFAIPVSITVEGANILTRNLIIFGQGAIRCHPYILQEMECLSAPDSAEKIKQLDRLFFSHIGYLMSNAVRTVWRGLTGGLLMLSPVSGPTAPYYRQLTRMSSALAFVADISMIILGGALKRKERISARLGDILSQLYLASAVLKYFKDNDQSDHDLNYVKWCIETCLYEIQRACDELFLSNFPNKWLGKLLHWCIFPFGTSYRKPNDKLYHRVVNLMLAPSDFRDRLTRDCFISDEEDDAMRRLDTALEKRIEIEPLLKKVHIAIQNGILSKRVSIEEQLQMAVKKAILTTKEAAELQIYNALHHEVIKVNEFTFDLSSVVL